MSPLGNQRRKKSRAYEILVVPQGDGGTTKSFKANNTVFALWGGAAFLVFFLIFILLFRFTWLGLLVGVDVRGEDARKKAEEETQRRIVALAEEIAVVKDYNSQLRKALGERTEKESSNPEKTEQQSNVQEPVQNVEPQLDVVASYSPAEISTTVANPEGLKASFPLLQPVSGVLTQGFQPLEKHFGIDYAAKQGSPVYAAAEGYVVFAGWTYDDGNMTILAHGGGYITAYKHNSALLKPTGSLVHRGELISLVGNTGESSKGPHLHFEVLKDGIPQDPVRFILNSKKAM